MAKVRGKDTRPELVVRRLAHALGFRFRLHRRDLPGSPDLVFPRLQKAVFVHGCFWHRHSGCSKASTPKTRVGFWKSKFAANVQRDARATVALEEMGWDVCVVWECETADGKHLARKLKKFLGVGRHKRSLASKRVGLSG
jgi:DNA mismatch endonuclease (patch repair protein)